jgi:hypothetical protein
MRFARQMLSRYPLLSGEALRQREAGRVEVLQQLLLLGLGARLQEPAPAVLVAHVLLIYARRMSPHNFSLRPPPEGRRCALKHFRSIRRCFV